MGVFLKICLCFGLESDFELNYRIFCIFKLYKSALWVLVTTLIGLTPNSYFYTWILFQTMRKEYTRFSVLFPIKPIWGSYGASPWTTVPLTLWWAVPGGAHLRRGHFPLVPEASAQPSWFFSRYIAICDTFCFWLFHLSDGSWSQVLFNSSSKYNNDPWDWRRIGWLSLAMKSPSFCSFLKVET
jgi:hypothetical protein